MSRNRKAVFLIGLVITLSLFGLTQRMSVAAKDKVLYRVGISGKAGKSVTVKQSGADLYLVVEGFEKPLNIKANGGGISACRTIIEHTSAQTTVTLSLPIADPRAPCRKLPGFVSIESQDPTISVDENGVKKISGSDALLRSTVKKSLGQMDSEGE